LATLAAPLGIELPEAYLAFMEHAPERGILVRHLYNPQDPAYEWWPEPAEFLEQDIHRGRWKKVELNAHYMRATAEPYLAGGHEWVRGPHGSRFGTERLRRGFWIGEVDGDRVFIDQQTLGVFAWLAHEDEVEQWAVSFADFVARGQQMGRFAEPSAAPDPARDSGSGSS
jgi:hypothetical protein